MLKKLYVHIGMPKTGTTAIQQFCGLNAEVLEKKGYAYPLFPYKYPGRSMVHNGMFLTGERFDENGKRCREEEKKIFEEGMNTVKQLFEKFDAVILSDEELWRTSFSRRKNFWKELNVYAEEIGFEVVIIVYLRSQDEYLNSLWNQRVKEGVWGTSVMTMEEWLEYAVKSYPVDYASMIDFLKQEVGEDKVIVRKYDRSGFFGGNIFTDFLNTLDLEFTDEYELPPREANLSLSGNNVEIKRIINSIPGYSRKDNQFFRKMTLNNGDGSAQKYSNVFMSNEQKKWLYDMFEESNKRVAKEIFGEDGNLFEYRETSGQVWEKDNPYLIDDVIRLMGQIAIELHEENRRLEDIINHPIRFYWNKLIRKIKRTFTRNKK